MLQFVLHETPHVVFEVTVLSYILSVIACRWSDLLKSSPSGCKYETSPTMWQVPAKETQSNNCQNVSELLKRQLLH